jgi:opacity protein-like surface antigen
MKKNHLFSMIALGIMTAFSSKAQMREITLGYGIQPQSLKQIENINNFAETKFQGSIGPSAEKSFAITGPIRLGITQYDTKHLTLGADFSYAAIEAKMTYADATKEIVNFNYFTLMANVNYQYTDNPKLSIYSGVHFGVSYVNAKNATTEKKGEDFIPAYQLTGLGIRYGEKIGVYAEFGYGFNGVINAGLLYKL